MFGNNSNMLFILILLLVFSFTGGGINSTENIVLIFTVFALLLSGGSLFGSTCDCPSAQ